MDGSRDATFHRCKNVVRWKQLHPKYVEWTHKKSATTFPLPTLGGVTRHKLSVPVFASLATHSRRETIKKKKKTITCTTFTDTSLHCGTYCNSIDVHLLGDQTVLPPSSRPPSISSTQRTNWSFDRRNRDVSKGRGFTNGGRQKREQPRALSSPPNHSSTLRTAVWCRRNRAAKPPRHWLQAPPSTICRKVGLLPQDGATRVTV